MSIVISLPATGTSTSDTLTFTDTGATYITTGYTTYASTSIAVADTTGIVAGQTVTDSLGYIPSGTTVSPFTNNVSSTEGTILSLSNFVYNSATTALSWNVYESTLPLTTTTISSTNSNTIYLTSLTGITTEQLVTGNGIIPGTVVTGVNTTDSSITLSAVASVLSGATVNFYNGGAGTVEDFNSSTNSTTNTGTISYHPIYAGATSTNSSSVTNVFSIDNNIIRTDVSFTYDTTEYILNVEGFYNKQSNGNVYNFTFSSPSLFALYQDIYYVIIIPTSTNTNSSGIYSWDFLFAVNSATNGQTTKNSKTITNITDTSKIIVGQTVTDSLGYIPSGTTVSTVDSTEISISNAATGTTSVDTLTFSVETTGTVSGVSTIITNIDTSGIAVLQTVTDSLGYIPSGTTVTSVEYSGNIITTSQIANVTATDTLTFTDTGTNYITTGTVTSNSLTIANIDTSGIVVGQTVTDSLGYIPSGTTVSTVDSTNNTITISQVAIVTANVTDTLTFSLETTGITTGITTSGTKTITNIDTYGIGLGQTVTDSLGYIPSGTTVTSINSNKKYITISNAATGTSGDVFAYSSRNVSGTITQNSTSITNIDTSLVVVGQLIIDTFRYIPSGTTVTSIDSTAGTITMSNAATQTSTDTFDFFNITSCSLIYNTTTNSYNFCNFTSSDNTSSIYNTDQGSALIAFSFLPMIDTLYNTSSTNEYPIVSALIQASGLSALIQAS